MGARVPTRRDGAVLLVNSTRGGELRAVRDVLTRSLDTPVVYLDHDDLRTASLALDHASGTLTVEGRRITPIVTWIRHSSASAIIAQARPTHPRTVLDAHCWADLLGQVAGRAAVALPGPAPTGAGQLHDAQRLGVAVPRTVVGTDVASAAAVLGADLIVVKTPDFRLYQPDPADWAPHLPAVGGPEQVGPARTGAPVVVQEYVRHSRELRVYHLDGGLCAFEVTAADPTTRWTDPDEVAVRHVACPPAAADVVRALCAAWGLRYGAFDLLVDARGEVMFLEANPDGDWLYYEHRAGWHGVSFMAAVMVRALFDSGGSREGVNVA